MVKTVLKMEGMMCPMCEAHMNDAIRRDFKVKKVTSSYVKNTTEIVAEQDIDDQSLATALESVGYKLLDSKREPYEKKGFFASVFARKTK